MVEIDPQTDFNMTTDEQRLKQVLINLLRNSYKFTSKGLIKLSVSPQQFVNRDN